jgi:type III secretion system FlhB-like substrate exporter
MEPFLKKKLLEVVDVESPELVQVLLTLIMNHSPPQSLYDEVSNVHYTNHRF